MEAREHECKLEGGDGGAVHRRYAGSGLGDASEVALRLRGAKMSSMWKKTRRKG
jgi:hypothetical protein